MLGNHRVKNSPIALTFGMDGRIGRPHVERMGREYPTVSCPRCGRVVKLAQLPAAGGAHDHQCFGCEKFDPLKSELVTGWLNGELGRPKRSPGSSPKAGSPPIAEHVK